MIDYDELRKKFAEDKKQRETAEKMQFVHQVPVSKILEVQELITLHNNMLEQVKALGTYIESRIK